MYNVIKQNKCKKNETLTIINVTQASNHHIKMISEESCELKTGITTDLTLQEINTC